MLAISTPTLWGYRNQSRFHTKVSSMNDEDIFGGTWKYLRRSVNISESFLLKSVLIPKINFVTLYTGIGYMSIPFQSYFETELRCFWKNNVKTLRFQKLCLYQWCHIQWEVVSCAEHQWGFVISVFCHEGLWQPCPSEAIVHVIEDVFFAASEVIGLHNLALW